MMETESRILGVRRCAGAEEELAVREGKEVSDSALCH